MFIKCGPESDEFKNYCSSLKTRPDQIDASVETIYTHINKNNHTVYFVPYTDAINDIAEGYNGAKLLLITIENVVTEVSLI